MVVNLNTASVKVQDYREEKISAWFVNLNTASVKVQVIAIMMIRIKCGNLNTASVKVQVKLFFPQGKNVKTFKHSIC